MSKLYDHINQGPATGTPDMDKVFKEWFGPIERDKLARGMGMSHDNEVSYFQAILFEAFCEWLQPWLCTSTMKCIPGDGRMDS